MDTLANKIDDLFHGIHGLLRDKGQAVWFVYLVILSPLIWSLFALGSYPVTNLVGYTLSVGIFAWGMPLALVIQAWNKDMAEGHHLGSLVVSTAIMLVMGGIAMGIALVCWYLPWGSGLAIGFLVMLGLWLASDNLRHLGRRSDDVEETEEVAST